MGWLGWTERDALDADVNSILLAMEGRIEMMYPEAKKQNGVAASSKFKDFVKSHNARYKAKQERRNGGRESKR